VTATTVAEVVPARGDNYLTDGTSLATWLLDPRPQTDRSALCDLNHDLLLHRRRGGRAD
jgi:hypothetical protein